MSHLPRYGLRPPIRILSASLLLQGYRPVTPPPPEQAGERARIVFDVQAAPPGTYEGETFDLALYRGTSVEVVTFEFDQVGDGVAVGNVPIDISTAVTTTDVANAMREAFEGEGMRTLDVAGEPQAFVALQPSPGIHGSGLADDNLVPSLANLVTVNGEPAVGSAAWFGGATALPAIIGPQPAALLLRDPTEEDDASAPGG